eukprot:11892124-Prorocentrum_lima.AAC.1
MQLQRTPTNTGSTPHQMSRWRLIHYSGDFLAVNHLQIPSYVNGDRRGEAFIPVGTPKKLGWEIPTQHPC